jgi:methylated-DNA-[protein]-cysteine S-methyltransferase
MNPRIEAQTRIDTPLGPLTLAATPAGLAGAWFAAQTHHPGPIGVPDAPNHPHLALAAQEFAAYWRDPAHRFAIPLDAAGTPFQRAVWQALLAIASGSLSTYGEIARRIGRPAGVRAVGAAVGRNPISIVVPCHRVIGSDGTLTGYAGGLPRKEALLRHERALAATLFDDAAVAAA